MGDLKQNFECLQSSSFLVIGYTKIAVSTSCKDNYTYVGYLQTIDICARKCVGWSTVFVYGKTYKRCSTHGCSCYCINGATKEGVCTKPYAHSYFDMYRFNGKLIRKCLYSGISLRRTHHKADTLYKADKDFVPILQFSGQTL